MMVWSLTCGTSIKANTAVAIAPQTWTAMYWASWDMADDDTFMVLILEIESIEIETEMM